VISRRKKCEIISRLFLRDSEISKNNISGVNMKKYDLIATAVFGVEAVVSRELKRLGYEEQTVENGRVIFKGDEEAICRANLWLRTAERVFIRVGEFTAFSFEELFEKTKELPWHEWLPENANFPVEGKSVKSKLFSVSDCQAIVKKAIVEKMKQKYRKEWFAEDGPKYKIEVGLLKDVVTLTIDTSGSGLHKRGYRRLVTQAPIKETLAAALILISRWNKERQLIDPLCGAGTIPIEAALIGRNIAPGIGREFDFESWEIIDKGLWKKIKEEAYHSINNDIRLNIHGYDINGEVLKMARYHAKEAGVDEDIHFQQRSVYDTSSKGKYGFIITNPPYGERIGEINEVKDLYKKMGLVFKNLDKWSYYIITSYDRFEECFGKKASKKRKLYNGRKECCYYQYFGEAPPKKLMEKNEKLL